MRWGVIPMQFPFITYGMELYINDSIPTDTNIEQMYVHASELRQFWHFYILKLLFLSIFCWYIENESWFNFIGGGGGGGKSPPPPPQYASAAKQDSQKERLDKYVNIFKNSFDYPLWPLKTSNILARLMFVCLDRL